MRGEVILLFLAVSDCVRLLPPYRRPVTLGFQISQDELLELYESMGIDPDDDDIRLHSVYVRGIDDLSEFQIENHFPQQLLSCCLASDSIMNEISAQWPQVTSAVLVMWDFEARTQCVPKGAYVSQIATRNC
uniref:Uncharacterized protein n=1 Tax=Parascaris equorum TaxID=6256 RepID=A0A914RZU3_PAREQ